MFFVFLGLVKARRPSQGPQTDVCVRDAHVAVPAIGVAKPGTTVRLRSSGAEPGHNCRMA